MTLVLIHSQLQDTSINYKLRKFVDAHPQLTIFNPRIFYRISAGAKNLFNRQIQLAKCG